MEIERIMKLRKATIALTLFTALFLLIANLATAATQTLTGVITDDMCGRKHAMVPGKPDSECIRACVKAGSKYALLAGDKIYTLAGETKQIEQMAGKRVKITGDVTGMTVKVNAIGAAK